MVECCLTGTPVSLIDGKDIVVSGVEMMVPNAWGFEEQFEECLASQLWRIRFETGGDGGKLARRNNSVG